MNHLKQHRAERQCSMGAIDGTQCCPFHRRQRTLSLLQYCTVVLVRRQQHSIVSKLCGEPKVLSSPIGLPKIG